MLPTLGQIEFSSLNHVGKGYQIEHQKEDGYINVTNLCKAGGKKFNGWNRLQKN